MAALDNINMTQQNWENDALIDYKPSFNCKTHDIFFLVDFKNLRQWQKLCIIISINLVIDKAEGAEIKCLKSLLAKVSWNIVKAK